MPKVWHINRRDEKNLLRTAEVGDTYYGTEYVSQHVAPYEDPTLTGRWTVTHMHPLLGGPMCGSKSLEQVLREHGPLTDRQPKGQRGIWEPSPQVAGPLGNDEAFGRPLDKAEIRGLRKRVRENLAGQKEAKRGRWI